MASYRTHYKNTGIVTSTGSNVNTGINMVKHKSKHNAFLLSWDMTGLESCIDITNLEKLVESGEKKRMWQILSDPDACDPGNQSASMLNQMVQHILLRARANSQRHYEVYTIQTTPGVSEQDMWDMFTNDPQMAADLVRERGNQLYSDRVSRRTQVIE
jgi:hypothetical protein